MKSFIIYFSIHHGNTEKIARAMAEVLSTDLVKPLEINPEALQEYDLVSSILWGGCPIRKAEKRSSSPQVGCERLDLSMISIGP